jgi:hypothetical protein
MLSRNESLTSSRGAHFQDLSNDIFSQYFLRPLATFLHAFYIFSRVFYFSSTQTGFLLHLAKAISMLWMIIDGFSSHPP